MKRIILLLALAALVLSGCGAGVGKGPYAVLSVDADTNSLEIETGDGLVFTVIAPEELDVSAVQPGTQLPLDEDFNDLVEEVIEAGETEDEEVSTFCTDTARQHPRLTTLARQGGVTYATLLELFCEGGLGVGEIMQAINIAASADLTLAEVVALHEELGNWGAVKKELGLIGKPDDKPGNDDDDDEDEEEDDD